VPFHFRLWHLADVSALAYVRFAPEAVTPNRSFRDIAVANDRFSESDFNLSKHWLNARDVAGGNQNSNSPARCGKTGGSPWTLAINGIGSNSMKRRYSTPFKCRFSLARSTLPCSARLSKISRSAPAEKCRRPLRRSDLRGYRRLAASEGSNRFTQKPASDIVITASDFFIFPWAVGSKWRGVGVGRTKHLYRAARSM